LKQICQGDIEKDKLSLRNHQGYKIMFKLLNFSVIFSFLMIISGCGQNHEPQFQTNHSQPIYPNYLRIPLSTEVTTLDPGLTHYLEMELVEQLFLGLTDFDPNTYEAVPELATDWQANENNTRYTFHLRQDVKWTDGQPVTAHDVVWTIQHNILPETNAPKADYTFSILKNATTILKKQTVDEHGNPATIHSDQTQTIDEVASLLGVRAIDDHTVEFTLEQPVGYFPSFVSLSLYRPLPRQVIEQYGDDWTKPEHIVTNGSYQLSQWNENKLILKKNPDYYDAVNVAIPEVHYYIVSRSSLGLAMYKNHELDIMGGMYLGLPKNELPFLQADPILRKEIYLSPELKTRFYGFNTQKPPMDNPLVRKAIAAAIDKQTLITFILKNNNTPATTFVRPPVFGSLQQEELGISFSPRQAKKWLAKAGYPDGKEFPPIILLYDYPIAAKAIQEMLKHYLNLKIEILKADSDYFDKLSEPSQAPHIFDLAWFADYPDANNWLHEFLHPVTGYNWIHWNNQEFAKIVDKAQQISNPSERQKLYRRAEQILIEEEAAIVPLYFHRTPILVKPRVKEWYNMSFGGQHIRNWRLEN